MMSKRPTPNFEATRYVDISKHWKRLGPIYHSPEAEHIWQSCMFEWLECKANGNPGFKPYERDFPNGYDACDWRYQRRGRPPLFWKFVCHSACHWLVDLNLFVAVSAWPKVPWRILSSRKHSNIWNGDYRKPVLFDANWLVFQVEPPEALRVTWSGRKFGIHQYSKHYLHHQEL